MLNETIALLACATACLSIVVDTIMLPPVRPH
jgi:hypothetical protein